MSQDDSILTPEQLAAKTVEFTIQKKNRKYFACRFATGSRAPFKLIIDDNSKDLEVGKTHSIPLHDHSVSTKYGTDLKFSVAVSKQEQETIKEAGIITLDAPYNRTLVKRCRELGGKWDKASRVWVFSELVADQIDELEERYAENIVAVEVRAKETVWSDREPLHFAGIPIVKGYSKTDTAEMYEDIYLVDGRIGCGGSHKNWGVFVATDSVLRFKVPQALIEDKSYDEDWEVTIL